MNPQSPQQLPPQSNVQSLNANGQPYDLVTDPIPTKKPGDIFAKQAAPGFAYSGAGISPTYGIGSLNFASDGNGWSLSSNGDFQSNGNHQVSTHFTPVARFKGVTLYISDGTSPNGTLSGATGDFLLGGDTGKIYFCVGSTTWVAPS